MAERPERELGREARSRASRPRAFEQRGQDAGGVRAFVGDAPDRLDRDRPRASSVTSRTVRRSSVADAARPIARPASGAVRARATSSSRTAPGVRSRPRRPVAGRRRRSCPARAVVALDRLVGAEHLQVLAPERGGRARIRRERADTTDDGVRGLAPIERPGPRARASAPTSPRPSCGVGVDAAVGEPGRIAATDRRAPIAARRVTERAGVVVRAGSPPRAGPGPDRCPSPRPSASR